MNAYRSFRIGEFVCACGVYISMNVCRVASYLLASVSTVCYIWSVVSLVRPSFLVG